MQHSVEGSHETTYTLPPAHAVSPRRTQGLWLGETNHQLCQDPGQTSQESTCFSTASLPLQQTSGLGPGYSMVQLQR